MESSSLCLNLLYVLRLFQVRYPNGISQEAKHLLKSLLCKNPHQRLGGGVRDALDVQDHPFYFNTNWEHVYEKKVGCLLLLHILVQFDRYSERWSGIQFSFVFCDSLIGCLFGVCFLS